MRRLWVRWLALVVFVAVLGTVFVNLGQWQLRRLHERRDHNVTITANLAAPPADLATVFGPGRSVGDDTEWQRVRVSGTFDAGHQLVVRYRSVGDGSGYEVLTPLRTAGGVAVLVDRGFLGLAGGQQIPDTAPPPPPGRVTVVGYARADENGRRSATVPVDASVRLVNSVEIGSTLPYPIVDGYVGLTSVTPAQTQPFVPVPPPELSDGPHFWYAVQWFMFAGIGAAGIVVFIRGDLRERRLEAATARSGEPAGAGPPDPDPHRGTDRVVAGSEHGPGPA